MKRVAYISIIFLFTFLTGFTESYAVSADDVDACRKLLEAGQKLMSENRCADALNCFRPLAELYDKTASHRQKLTCLYGIYGCVEASFYLGDYGAAFDYLLMADQITSADNLPVARLHSNYTMLYIVLASQNGKDALYRNALDHALLGFRLSLRENDTIASYRTFCDMASAAYVLNDFSRISNVEKQMRRLAASGHWRYKVALLQLKARKETVGKNFRAAVSAYDSILRVLPAETGNIRMYASVIKDRALSLGYAGYPAAAVQSLSEVERVSYLYNMKDLRFTSYNVGRRLYEMMPGQESEAAEMRRKATAIKDSLQSYMILGDMVQLEFIKERRDLQRKLAISDLKHDILLWGCIGLFVVLLVVISLLMLLRSKN